MRGGTGLFTGPPLYVWISNQLGNTGVLQRLRSARDNTTTRPFNPTSGHVQADERDGRARGQLRAQRHRSRLQVPAGLAEQHRARPPAAGRHHRAPTEYLYNKDVNGIYYINANLPAAQSAFAGVDTRPRWVGTRAPRQQPGRASPINNAAGNQVTAPS